MGTGWKHVEHLMVGSICDIRPGSGPAGAAVSDCAMVRSVRGTTSLDCVRSEAAVVVVSVDDRRCWR